MVKGWVNFWAIFDVVQEKASSNNGPKVNPNIGPNVNPTYTTHAMHSYYQGEIKHYERKGEAKPECTKKEMKDSKAQLRQFLFTY